MDVITHPNDMRAWSRRRQANGQRVAIVPTMGALHDGHLALVAEAHQHAEVVVATIFVNPTQFNQRADFDAYPRTLDDDLAALAKVGVDAVYTPDAATMYPEGFDTTVQPGALAAVLEGKARPGHFVGVTTVVSKLFAAVQPHVAIFGQKDFQQLAIIRRMTRDLDLGIDIVGLPTIREPDGLAMSSRNRRLTAEQRISAVRIYEGLSAAAEMVAAGETSKFWLTDTVSNRLRREPGVRLDYVALVDPDTLQPLRWLDDVGLLAVAAWFGNVRLIDNIVLRAPAAGSADV